MKKYSLVFFLFLLVGCGQEEIGHSEVSDKINDHLGVTPYLPEIDYPIGHAHIEYNTKLEDGEPVKGDPWKATVEYNISQDEKVDENFVEDWEESNRAEVIYGDLYMDKTAISVEIYNEGITSKGAETIDIEGHEVQYQHLERENVEVVVMHINFENTGYAIMYYIHEDENDIEEAKAFAKKIINNH